MILLTLASTMLGQPSIHAKLLLLLSNVHRVSHTPGSQCASNPVRAVCLTAAWERVQERDKQRALERRRGAAILAEQLKEREVEHLRQEDLLHQVRIHR